MGNQVIYNLMKNLITKKYYKTKEEATTKLAVYFAFNQITEEQMEELNMLAEEVYAPLVTEDGMQETV